MGEIHPIHYALRRYELLFQSSSNQSEELKTVMELGRSELLQSSPE